MDKQELITSKRVSNNQITRLLHFTIFLTLFFSLYLLLQLLTETNEDWVTTFDKDQNKLSLVALYKPEQIHISLGHNDSEIYVTWSTKAVAECHILYTEVESSLLMRSDTAQLITHNLAIQDNNWKKLTRKDTFEFHNYRARLTSLNFGEYLYKVECLGKGLQQPVSSNAYLYRSKNLSNVNETIKLAFYGDLGLINGQSINRLVRDVDEDRHDFIIHNGDFAYDLDTNNGEYGNEFMQKIEPIAARVPYQTSVGNHENSQNFTFYDMRFTMINRGAIDTGALNNYYYSFNTGPIHFIAFSTEFYYYLREVGITSLRNQYEWLIKDLTHASSAEERAKRPWIIVFGHRPMYCSSRDGDDCSKENNILRKGLHHSGEYALEKLFYDFGVDVQLYSHEHQYERFLPIFDGKVFNRSTESESYTNPLAPVHVISGSAGCQERIDPFEGNAKPGSVKRIADYGYTTIQATRCNLTFEQISDDDNGSVVDRFYITKSKQNFPVSSSHVELNC